MVGSIDVRVENQLVRFAAQQPVDQAAVVAQLGGVETGGVGIKVIDNPRATIVIDGDGKIVVHGTHRVEAARAAAKEFLLRMGLDESGLHTELGPVVASFEFGVTLDVTKMVGNLGAGEGVYDERLGAAIIEDTRHNLTLHIWPNGKCVATEARHPNMVAMAGVYWKSKFVDSGMVIERF